MKTAIIIVAGMTAFSCALPPDQADTLVDGTGTFVGTAVTAVTGGNMGLGAAATAGVTMLLNYLIGRKES